MQSPFEQLAHEARTFGKYPYSNIPELLAHERFQHVEPDKLDAAVRYALGQRVNNEILLTADHVGEALTKLGKGHVSAASAPIPSITATPIRPRSRRESAPIHRPQNSSYQHVVQVQLKPEAASFQKQITTEYKVMGGLSLLAAAMSGAGAYASLSAAFSGNTPDGKVDTSLVARGMLELAFAAGMTYVGVQSFRGR